ncbi:BTB/POZ domain-containing protein [Phthorimaea operculella]|nr:BTB/POZ domain-containing protein [Phthorimaea operculella]
MAQCKFIWESFKKNICEGFSNLQQHEELVDMTLVAEGHIVKVHKSLLALASPYLKAIIQSAQYQHPIVFLTHIRHEILGYILEYVYTGEVALPCDDMAEFIEACKSLHISGARDLIPPAQKNKVEDRNNVKLNKEQNPHSKEEHGAAGRKRKRMRLQEERYIERDDLEDLNKETIEQTDVENFIRNVNVIAPPVIPIINTNVSMGTSANTTSIPRIIIDAGKIKDLPSTSSAKVTDIVPVAKTAKTRPKVDVILPTNKVSSKLAKKFGNSLTPYYMLSSKNSIQMILNRYVYNLHHQAKREKKMRWRCADYRHRRCPAYIDTIDAVISKR